MEEVEQYLQHLQNTPDQDEFPMSNPTIHTQTVECEVAYYKIRHTDPVLAEMTMEFYLSLPPVKVLLGGNLVGDRMGVLMTLFVSVVLVVVVGDSILLSKIVVVPVLYSAFYTCIFFIFTDSSVTAILLIFSQFPSRYNIFNQTAKKKYFNPYIDCGRNFTQSDRLKVLSDTSKITIQFKN